MDETIVGADVSLEFWNISESQVKWRLWSQLSGHTANVINILIGSVLERRLDDYFSALKVTIFLRQVHWQMMTPITRNVEDIHTPCFLFSWYAPRVLFSLIGKVSWVRGGWWPSGLLACGTTAWIFWKNENPLLSPHNKPLLLWGISRVSSHFSRLEFDSRDTSSLLFRGDHTLVRATYHLAGLKDSRSGAANNYPAYHGYPAAVWVQNSRVKISSSQSSDTSDNHFGRDSGLERVEGPWAESRLVLSKIEGVFA